jgi:hypothetical protein
VDHNTRTIDCQDTLHVMGLIAVVTPELKESRVIKPVRVSNEELTSIGRVKIHFYFKQTNNASPMLYEGLAARNTAEPISKLDALLQLSHF